MSNVHVVLDPLYTLIALGLLILFVRQVELMRMPVTTKARKDDRKPWNTGN